jgi:hypothetical protein
MSSNFIAINAVPLQLTAYATSGLPVTYKILSGADKISITLSGDYYYINPIALGFARIVAYQTGSADYAPAVPVSKLVRVIGLPEDLNVNADIMVIPQVPSDVEVNVLEPPVAVVATLNSVPLEPTKVKVTDNTPQAPIFVRTLTAPNDLSSVVVYDYDARPAGYPNGMPIVLEATIMEAPDAPESISVNPIVTPTMHYVLNLSRKVEKQYISENAIVDTKEYTATELWDLSNNDLGVVTLRNNYLKTSKDSNGLTYNPLWEFSSRPSLSRASFYYEDENNPQYNGKYQKESSGSSVYDICWKEVGSQNPKYIHFVTIKMHTYVVHVNELESTDGVVAGMNVFLQLEDELYQSGHIGNADFQNWLHTNVYENYVAESIHKLDNELVIGGYVFSYNANPVKVLNINSLIPYDGDKTLFDTDYPSSEDKEKLIKEYISDKTQRSLNIYYTKTAGDILGAYNAWDSDLEKNNWSPSMPVPFEEVYVGSPEQFGVNPYAIYGDGISLFDASIQSFASEPTNVTIEEL